MTGMHPENNKLARWQSVKVVSAGEIVDIMPLEDGPVSSMSVSRWQMITRVRLAG
jgi:hypothetical protein